MAGCHPSVSECHKEVLRWHSGMTVANGNLEARVWCRNEAKAAEKGLKAWQGAIRQFRNAIKRC